VSRRLWNLAAALALLAGLGRGAALGAEVAGARAAGPSAAIVTVLDTPPAASEVEMSLLELANGDRVRNGLAPAEPDLALLEIARARAEAQLGLPALSHYDGSGQLAITRLLAAAGLGYTLVGENLARSSGADLSALELVEQAFMNSPAHRQNILEPSFNRLAIGAAFDDSGRVTFAEIFRATP